MFKLLRCCKFYTSKRCFAKKKQIEEMKYLNVAEKNDAAKTIAGQLSNGTSRRVSVVISLAKASAQFISFIIIA